MTLSFTLEDGLFVAEFEAISRFNLHLERPASGSIYMKQKTVKDGSYVIVKDFGWNRDGDLIIDADCGQGAVYPKWIRLESAVEPSVAEVTFESESSGGGAGTESGGEMRYYQIDMKENTETFVQFYGANMKADMGEGEVLIVGVGLIFAYNIPKANWKAVAINVDMPTYSPSGGGIISFREQLESNNGSIDDLAKVGLINITKEQFYNLEA